MIAALAWRHRGLRVALAVVAGLTVAQAGCSESLQPGSGVAVRVRNNSSVQFASVTLYTVDGPVTFQDVSVGLTTPYVEVSAAYRFATTEVVIVTDTLRLQVIDYVGEEPLERGRYSYLLDVADLGSASPSLTQQLSRAE